MFIIIKFYQCVSLFHTQYDHSAWFHIKYNHSLCHRCKFCVIVDIYVPVFYFIDSLVYPQYLSLITRIYMDEQWCGLVERQYVYLSSVVNTNLFLLSYYWVILLWIKVQLPYWPSRKLLFLFSIFLCRDSHEICGIINPYKISSY